MLRWIILLRFYKQHRKGGQQRKYLVQMEMVLKLPLVASTLLSWMHPLATAAKQPTLPQLGAENNKHMLLLVHLWISWLVLGLAWLPHRSVISWVLAGSSALPALPTPGVWNPFCFSAEVWSSSASFPCLLPRPQPGPSIMVPSAECWACEPSHGLPGLHLSPLC